MTTHEILNAVVLEAEYACFNRRRSLRFQDEGTPSVEVTTDCVQVKDPSAPLDTYVNRLIVPHLANAPNILKVIQQYHALGLTPSIDVLPHALTLALSSALVDAGYRPVHELVFLRMKPAAGVYQPEPGISIEKIAPGEGRLFLDAISASIGRELPPAILASKEHFYEGHPFLCYMARIDQNVAGLATLYLVRDQAWMANAFTFPSFRGRGVQSALIQRRIHDAAALGVKTLLTDVEFQSASFRNVQRLGFEFHYTATTWERPGP